MNWKVIWKSLRHEEMRQRILAVVGMIFIFRVLAQIPLPLDDPSTLSDILTTLFTSSNDTQLFGLLDTISGGALANFSIMLIGLGPYINASIIMQLLTQAIPKLENLNKEGEYGRKKINQFTRMLTFPLAIIQSIGALFLVRQQIQATAGTDYLGNASPTTWVLMIAALTGGAMLLMWLGELVTEQGIGNGISLLITASIVAILPGTIASIGASVLSGPESVTLLGKTINYTNENLIIGGVIIASVIVTTWVVVMLNEAQRRLTINYAKRVQGNRTYGGVTTTLPVKLITAGVIPIIFAVAFLSVPSFAAQLMINSSSANLQEWGTNLSQWFAQPTANTFAFGGWQAYIYPVTYFLLIVMFTFFYTSITFNAKEIAESLNKQGGFIEGIRSGDDTEKYLRSVVNRLTLFGSVALGLVALGPIIMQIFIATNITIGGVSILILVAVALETMRQVESRALMVTYDDYSTPDFVYGPSDDEPKKSDKKRRRLSLPKRKK